MKSAMDATAAEAMAARIYEEMDEVDGAMGGQVDGGTEFALLRAAPENIPRPRLRSKTSATPTDNKTVRRTRLLIAASSSDDMPSSHDSIYEAMYFSGSDNSGHAIQMVDIPARRSSRVEGTDENISPRHTSMQDTRESLVNCFGQASLFDHVPEVEFRYGNGTPLETISERQSISTMRSIRSMRSSARKFTKSADDMPIPFLGHRDSFKLIRTPRRNVSVSMDDLASIQEFYHEACSFIEKESRKQADDVIYAQPKSPLQPPPNRPPTPEGMPSWTAAQTPSTPRRVAKRDSNRNFLQRLFNAARPDDLYSAASTIPPTNERIPRDPMTNRLAPRFRPPRSVYGEIGQHPFNSSRMPMAIVAPTPITVAGPSYNAIAPPARSKQARRKLEKRVRFTPSATARDSAENNFRNAMESTSGSAIHPFQDSISIADPPVEICPHRRGRRKLLKSLFSHSSNSSLSGGPETLIQPPPCSEIPFYHGPPAHERTRPMSAISAHSTTHLVGGNQMKGDMCWRCKVVEVWKKIDSVWMSSVDSLCFYFCGYDVREHDSAAPSRMT